MNNPKLKIRYHRELFPTLPDIQKFGNFIDLCSAESYDYKAGDTFLINLGISVEIENGYWCQLVPRSSTFKKYGIIETNSFGVIDTDYCGDNDIWKLPVYALKDGHIDANDRVCQFRVVQELEPIIDEVDHLYGKNRGGFGSSGTK